ncbi:MAG: 2-oxoacid:acceptor oxidoreductase subunit alpha [Methanobacteriota archaeon]|nr:MAG: 2-oxoacid:acceptor oxidoreductase subunit alpha [Euryarchaeota archaeon]
MAGEGAFVMGRTLGKLFVRGGYHVMGYPEYPSLIRTGHNSYTIVASRELVRSPRENTDILIGVSKDGVLFHKDSVKENGIILYDGQVIKIEEMEIKESIKKVNLPIHAILKEVGAPLIMKNVAFLGAALAVVGYPLSYLEKVIEEEFTRKGQEVVKLNQEVAKKAYEYIEKEGIKANVTMEAKENKRMYLSGNEAVGLGALAGGLGIYSAYPMTPASSVLHFLVQKQVEGHDIAVVQAEDEIAAAQFAIGANYAGVRAMTGTSGGGFALMTEGVGMAAIAETPVVFFLAQRTGPSTGMPTWTEQGDLFQVLGASQGEFLRVILAPGTVEEAYYGAAEALNIADRYQLPVFLLSDKFLSESHFTMEKPQKVEIDRGKLITDSEDLKELMMGERFLRYKDSEDGISARTIPGVKNGQHVATSYEHYEDSFTTEKFDERVKQVDKRERKLKALLEESWKPKVYGEGEIYLACWGSQVGPLLDAQKSLAKDGINVGVIHFTWLYPLDEKKVLEVLEGKKVMMFENNSTGLFSKLLRMETGWKANGLVLKYNGRQFFKEQVEKVVREAVENGIKEKVVVTQEVDNYEYYTPWRYV